MKKENWDEATKGEMGKKLLKIWQGELAQKIMEHRGSVIVKVEWKRDGVEIVEISLRNVFKHIK